MTGDPLELQVVSYHGTDALLGFPGSEPGPAFSIA